MADDGVMKQSDVISDREDRRQRDKFIPVELISSLLTFNDCEQQQQQEEEESSTEGVQACDFVISLNLKRET